MPLPAQSDDRRAVCWIGATLDDIVESGRRFGWMRVGSAWLQKITTVH
ncbi:MAG: hypothetical protein WCI28_11790 [Opitutaceae bacterium]